jgi:hypothetical protein
MDLREAIHKAASSYDGHATNGSVDAILKVVEDRVAEVEKEFDALRESELKVWQSRESEQYRQRLMDRLVAAEKRVAELENLLDAR